ncbi:MAG: DUF445 family protein [Paludibacteraceae bacterium]|nr:DUF445 family protein [Paludibacteraceae bacterium]
MYRYLIPPVLGAVIGYLTNDLAIRMLFRPHYPHYLWGFRLPFTPGLIPKEKGRLAMSIAEAINENLLDKETVEKNLLSEEMLSKIAQGVDSFFEKQSENPETVCQFASRFIPAESIGQMATSTVDKFSNKVAQKISESDLGRTISHKVVEYVMQKLSSNMGLLGAFGSALAEPAENLLTKHLDVILKENSGEIVHDMVGEHVADFLDTPMCTLFKRNTETCSQVKDLILSAYQSIITDHLPKVLEAIDLRKIVEERIKEMDVEEMERLILQVMKKELRAIIWLGALLGGVIGLFNLLLM